MTHAMLTFVAPLGLDKLEAAEAAIDRLGNPATDSVRTALAPQADKEDGTHFASLHAIASPDGTSAYLVFEFSADGDEDSATARIVAALKPMLRPILMLSTAWVDGADVTGFLARHKVRIGNGLLGNPGLAFVGTPGFTVGRILFEERLARACARILEGQGGGQPALARIAVVRDAIAADPQFAGALGPATAAPPFSADPGGLIATGVGQLLTIYLWPVVALVLVVGVSGGLSEARSSHGAWAQVGDSVLGAVRTGWVAAWVALVATAVAAVIAYVALRKAEASDSLETRPPSPTVNREMFSRENKSAQNHMISVTQRKPGWLRWLTLRLVFWVIGLASTKVYPPGFLSDIGTIHFARWVTVPGTRDLLFLSNYGGSWESYLEDFITRAHAGLTGIWSNTVGFPRTENLFQLGATDGDRFKRFARRSMVATRFWYGAYPNLTTAVIRSNAVIRAGLSGVMTEDEAINWLALFGSAARPAVKLASSDIQSLVFGGLGFLKFGTCMICTLPTEPSTAREWLKSIRGEIAFNDGRRLVGDAVLTLALSWRGLRRLGIPADAEPTFPFAFVEGMTQEDRSRILGDLGENAPAHWRWGGETTDAAVLVYGRSAEALTSLRSTFLATCAQCSMPQPHEVPLQKVIKGKVEPFGFADGISQPIIRGTYKSLRGADPIHIVEPGEMLLGYPDARGHIPPSPTLPPSADPGNKLPLFGAPNDFARSVADATRDLGINGSFLVIRELEQDVKGFNAYCAAEADRLKGRLASPYAVTAEYVAAKLVGRWRDGSSLVRNPYESATDHRAKLYVRAEHQVDRGDATTGTPLTESVDVNRGSRPKSRPENGAPIDPAGDRSAESTAEQALAEDGAPRHTRVPTDNDFLFGAEDPQGTRCPYGAHARRANPRDSLDPGNADQIAISNRHRITRVGRSYVPADGKRPGLLFMCLCADIERQFEFLQQTWLRSPTFHGLSCEKDPLLGDAEEGNCGFTLPTPDGPIGLKAMPRFVTTRGGGYFFLPGRRLIDYLADPA